MFVLIAPQRQPERQASVIPACEASALCFYGLQMEENSPTIPCSVEISLICVQTFLISVCVHCKYTGVGLCAWKREREWETLLICVLWCSWQQDDNWKSGIRVVSVEKQHSDNLWFIFKSCVSYPPPLLLKERFVHLYSIICQGCSHSEPQRKSILHVITEAVTKVCKQRFYKKLSIGRVNMTFLVQSQRDGCVNFKWEQWEIYLYMYSKT